MGEKQDTFMKKIAMFVFNGDPMCFIHVLLNGLDMHKKEYQIRIIMEGTATGLTPKLAESDHPLHKLWEAAKTAGLVAGVCEACSRKTGALDAAKNQGLVILNEMNGHPSMARYREDGFEIITF